MVWSDYSAGSSDVNGQINTQLHWQVWASLSTGPDLLLHDRFVGENGAGWQQREADLTPLLGKAFSLVFSVTNGIRYFGVVTLDDVLLEVTPGFVEYEVYLGSSTNFGSLQLVGKSADTTWNLSGLPGGSTNYWKIVQNTDGLRATSSVFSFVVGGSLPPNAPTLFVEMIGDQLHLHALTQPGAGYIFEQTETVDGQNWQPLGDELTGDGAEANVYVTADTDVHFFRLRVTH